MIANPSDRWFGRFTTPFLMTVIAATLLLPTIAFGQDDDEKDKKKEEQKDDSESLEKVRWGKRRGESDEAYDKRYASVLKKVKKDKEDDKSGGATPLYTLMPTQGSSFIVRSDVSAEFTADTAMYMEMLHREYGAAYAKLLGGVPSRIKEPIEVVVFENRATYMGNGGQPGSGGQFMQSFKFPDRGPYWKAGHFRLMQFTDGKKNFAKWEKGTLKHEAAHMEIQMRLGLAVDMPRWFNEGHACVFEWWDFDKTIDENFAAIPDRGRYAPFVRRAFDTDRWKDFHYIWNVDPQTWFKDMTSPQGYLNYCEAWSLAGYMMNEGKKGRADFQKVFTLSIRVGADRKVSGLGKKTLAWEQAFTEEDRKKLEDSWTEWVKTAIARDKSVENEAYYLKRAGYKADVTASLEPYSEEERKTLADEIKKEEKAIKNKIEK